MTITKIIGKPGTGKTTALLAKVKELVLTQGYEPRDICYCTFTRAMAKEGIARLAKELDCEPNDFVYSSTIHSLGLRSLRGEGFNPMETKDYEDFMKKYGYPFDAKFMDEKKLTFEDEEKEHKPLGNKMLDWYNAIRNQQNPKIFENDLSEQDWIRLYSFNPIKNDKGFTLIYMELPEPIRPYTFVQRYEKFKRDKGRVDFADMLIKPFNNGYVPPVDFLLVDEFQDMNPLQYNLYTLWSEHIPDCVIAGDPAQSIYGFAGGDPSLLINAPCDEELFLGETHRNFSELIPVARRLSILGGTGDRMPSTKSSGYVGSLDYIDSVDKIHSFMRFTDKSVLFLSRTNRSTYTCLTKAIDAGVVAASIDGKLGWSKKRIDIYNACVKLAYKQDLSIDEARRFFENAAQRGTDLPRGIKTDIKDWDSSVVTHNDLSELGMNLLFSNYTSPSDFADLLYKRENKLISMIHKRLFFTDDLIDGVNVFFGTKHRSKGLEAEIVFLNVTYPRSILPYCDEKEEARLDYVGATRASEALFFLTNVDRKYIPLWIRDVLNMVGGRSPIDFS